jgi:hypothetical protein
MATNLWRDRGDQFHLDETKMHLVTRSWKPDEAALGARHFINTQFCRSYAASVVPPVLRPPFCFCMLPSFHRWCSVLVLPIRETTWIGYNCAQRRLYLLLFTIQLKRIKLRQLNGSIVRVIALPFDVWSCEGKLQYVVGPTALERDQIRKATRTRSCDQIRKATRTRSMRSAHEGNAHSLHAISSIPITAAAN